MKTLSLVKLNLAIKLSIKCVLIVTYDYDKFYSVFKEFILNYYD